MPSSMLKLLVPLLGSSKRPMDRTPVVCFTSARTSNGTFLAPSFCTVCVCVCVHACVCVCVCVCVHVRVCVCVMCACL